MAGTWHGLPVEEAFRKLDASPLGLSAEDAAARLARHGPNELVQTTRISPLKILLSQFTDVLVIVLIVAAAISAFLGLREPEGTAELLDAALILVIVVLNATLGFVQEYRAERSLQALKALAAPKAHVLREGETSSSRPGTSSPGTSSSLRRGTACPRTGGSSRPRGCGSTRPPSRGSPCP